MQDLRGEFWREVQERSARLRQHRRQVPPEGPQALAAEGLQPPLTVANVEKICSTRLEPHFGQAAGG